jgi:hypothetical protein
MRQKVVRSFWLVFGWIWVAIGVIGIFLPILPTVPFLLLAAFCFSRGSERWHRWLLNHPVFGHPIRDWNERRVIRPRAKAFSAVTISAGVGSVLYFTPPNLFVLKGLVICSMVGVMVFILLQKSQ